MKLKTGKQKSTISKLVIPKDQDDNPTVRLMKKKRKRRHKLSITKMKQRSSLLLSWR